MEGTSPSVAVCGDRRSCSKSMNGGRWTDEEHERFLAGLTEHGREWKKVASKIKTRTSAQIRSHAQKYFAKLAKDSGGTMDSLSDDGNLSDMDSWCSVDTNNNKKRSMPSPDEVLRAVSPSARQSLDDAEVCALQVLAWYATAQPKRLCLAKPPPPSPSFAFVHIQST
ncbi:hypothetical protein H257_12759 [Aphanomyces astaci]|uniref:Uncharacterized protein n=1 Tax=Aphanomyces astaci TaxID=112090 RepID=W4FWL8_APHAT|nr:hypothetical protein H257_12759 [Aphanomyces astaci]ETV71925.1 hypothetical protein H257_12759 [Aphanomyces astaci]RQM23588.1 hypothetical protein B5M09_004055 [Aphanomyces astaci]|eukprot:XP_009838368.1 hypothetical protein H257_12759 [Aphanomyces astaci]